MTKNAGEEYMEDASNESGAAAEEGNDGDTRAENADRGVTATETEPEARDEDGASRDDEESEHDDGVPETASEDEDDGEDEDPDEDGNSQTLPLVSVVEAVLFAAREPLKAAQIARAVGKRTRQEAVRDAVAELNVQYLESGRAFEIAEISGRYQLMSRPEYAAHIMRIYPKKDLADKDKTHRLTPAAMDTLAIIAYKQPVTRADIEHIRGVGCGAVIKALVERGSVKPVGKRTDLVGQPLVYGTTEAFLAEFGLGTLDELPLRNEFIGMLGSEGAEVEYSQPEEDRSGDAAQPQSEIVEADPEIEPETKAEAETELDPSPDIGEEDAISR